MFEKWILFISILALGIVSCNNNPSTLTKGSSTTSHQICAYQNIYSEAQLANDSSLFPTFDDAVVVTLEGGGETHNVHYLLSQAKSFYLNLNTEKVSSVSLEDLNGNVKASFNSHQENVSVTLEAGDYLLKIQSNNQTQGRLVIQPGGCASSSISKNQFLRNSIVADYSHPGVYINEISSSQTLIPANTNTTAFVGVVPQGTLNKAILITSWNDYVQFFGDLNNDYPLSYSVYTYYSQGGGNAYVVGVSNEPTPPTVSELLGDGGLHALDDVSSINLYVFPDLMNLSSADVSQFAQTAVPYVNDREGMLILDPPQGMETPDQMINFIQQGLAKLPLQNTVIYYPSITILNPITSQNYTLGAAGIMAGLYAYVDNNEGVWDSPANFSLDIVTSLTYSLTDAENSQLNVLGINALRIFTDRGTVVWGARTLDPNNEEFRYINLRRLYLFIQQSVNQGLEWIVFEPDDATLWADVTSSVSNFMNILWQEGAFAGDSASDAYQVLCDNTNNPPDNILNDILGLTVTYTAVDPGQYSTINFTFQLAGN